MLTLLKFFCIFFLSFEFIFFLFDDLFYNFFFFFSMFMYFNYFFKNEKTINFLNLDLFFKFILLVLKTPNFLLNFFINTIKKIYVYLRYFKYKFHFSTLNILYKKYLNNLFIWWRPLFKKTSYFGYFRSNRSKWIK